MVASPSASSAVAVQFAAHSFTTRYAGACVKKYGMAIGYCTLVRHHGHELRRLLRRHDLVSRRLLRGLVLRHLIRPRGLVNRCLLR